MIAGCSVQPHSGVLTPLENALITLSIISAVSWLEKELNSIFSKISLSPSPKYGQYKFKKKYYLTKKIDFFISNLQITVQKIYLKKKWLRKLNFEYHGNLPEKLTFPHLICLAPNLI